MNNKKINRINVLPELVANQIAAGEVVERPASIVKELMENSIDANSTLIRIYLENGGISGIKVMDNGDGIHADDLPLVFLQHATSKITTVNDLLSIYSLGFRGEALASIFSVARTNIISTQLEPSGTTVEVKDLFYNIPARRKFLRSNKTEFNYALEIFKRIALSNFAVGFMLYHNNKLIKNLPIAMHDDMQKQKRLTKLFGKSFTDHAVFFDIEQNGLKLYGWMSTVESVSSSNIQYLYLNKRIVKDKLLSGAVRQATVKLSLPQSYCLYLDLDPGLVDINVHPTKQEVRFRDPHIVYAFVYENILEILNGKINSKNYDNMLLNNNIIEVVNNDEINCVEAKGNINLDIKLFSIFNNKYIIFEKEPLVITFMCVTSSLKWLLAKKLQNNKLLSSFPLIIPERIKLDNKNNMDTLEAYIKLLEVFKFVIDQVHEDILLIRAVPNCFHTFKIAINYREFLLEFLQIKSSVLTNIDNLKIVELIIKHINIKYCNSYTKNDLIALIIELTKEGFCFNVLNEQQFSKLINI